jgi:hypothetical protein
MTTKTRFTFTALALAASLGAANAQTAQSAQEHDAHHPADQAAPQAQAPAPTTGQRPAGAAPGMMGGDMGQMMGRMQQMMQGGMMPMGMGPGGRQPFRHIEGQLAFFKTELHITDAQLPQWNALADVIRANARRLQETMTPPAQGSSGVSALPDQLERHAAQLAAMLDATKAVQGAAKPLYAVLTDDQKKIADELMADHMRSMRMRGL